MKKTWTICLSLAFMLLVCGAALAGETETTALPQVEVAGEESPATAEVAPAATAEPAMSHQLTVEELKRIDLSCSPYCSTGLDCQGCYKQIYCGGGPAFCDSGYICDCR